MEQELVSARYTIRHGEPYFSHRIVEVARHFSASTLAMVMNSKGPQEGEFPLCLLEGFTLLAIMMQNA